MRTRSVLFLSLIAAGGIVAVYPLMLLSLESPQGVILRRMVRQGDTFELGYLHSVARSDVWDTFQIDPEGKLLLLETRFQGQGYGLPGGPAVSEQWTRDGDWFKLTQTRRVVPSLDWRVQPDWKDRFRFRNEAEIDMSSRVGSGLIHIQVVNIRVVEWIAYRLHRLMHFHP